MSRFYTEYWRDTPIVNERGWRVYDRLLTYGSGEQLPLAHCWNKEIAFQIRDLLNAEEDQKREFGSRTKGAVERLTRKKWGTNDPVNR